jgi:hypothetical protein
MIRDLQCTACVLRVCCVKAISDFESLRTRVGLVVLRLSVTSICDQDFRFRGWISLCWIVFGVGSFGWISFGHIASDMEIDD